MLAYEVMSEFARAAAKIASSNSLLRESNQTRDFTTNQTRERRVLINKSHAFSHSSDLDFHSPSIESREAARLAQSRNQTSASESSIFGPRSREPLLATTLDVPRFNDRSDHDDQLWTKNKPYGDDLPLAAAQAVVHSPESRKTTINTRYTSKLSQGSIVSGQSQRDHRSQLLSAASERALRSLQRLDRELQTQKPMPSKLSKSRKEGLKIFDTISLTASFFKAGESDTAGKVMRNDTLRSKQQRKRRSWKHLLHPRRN